MIGCYPNGTLESTDDDDAVWARIVEAGVPLNIHVSLSQHMPAAHRAALPGYGRFFDAPNRIVQMIFAGVFDRFPELDVVVAEVDCGWVPYFKEQIDNNYRRLDAISDFHITALPSEYVERHLHFTYHHRPVRHREPRRGRRRAHPLVERLPAHLERLAALVGRDRRDVRGCRSGRTRSDPARQRRTPLRLRPLVRKGHELAQVTRERGPVGLGERQVRRAQRLRRSPG